MRSGGLGMARAGGYRDRATIQRLNAPGTDAYGNTSTAWADLTSRWVNLRETPGKEQIQSGAQMGVNMATMRLRKDTVTAAVTTADRVSVRGTTWDIESVIQLDAKGREMEFTLKRGVAA